MKPLFFSEFINLIEQKFGKEVLYKVKEKVHLTSTKNILNSNGFLEIPLLLKQFSIIVNISEKEILYVYGKHILNKVLNDYIQKNNLVKKSIELNASNYKVVVEAKEILEKRLNFLYNLYDKNSLSLKVIEEIFINLQEEIQAQEIKQNEEKVEIVTIQ